MHGSLRFMATALLAAAAPAAAMRVPGSPYPVCGKGLNSSTALIGFSTAGLSNDDAYTLMTLQGVTSKARPTIYRYSPGSDYELWLNQTAQVFGVQVTQSTDLAGLISQFASSLSGYVLTDMADNSTSVGIAAAAAMNVLAVTPANEALATGAGLKLLMDVRGKDLPWVLANLNNTKAGFRFSAAITVLQEPSKTCCMGDYAIATGALQWWQDDAASALAARVWGSMVPPFAMMGWGPDEYGTVTQVSQHGGMTIGSDWASNLDVLSNFDLPGFSQQGYVHSGRSAASASAPAPPAPVHTLCFLFSDGDNTQWLLGGFATDAKYFGSPDRGKVNMGWTLSPSLSDLAPAVMDYLYSKASTGSSPALPGRDVFVAGVSGAGYFYPDSTTHAGGPTGPAALTALADLTAAYMAKAGLRLVNILLHGEGYDDATVLPYLSQPNIDAVFAYNYDDYAGLKGNITFVRGKPVIGGRFNLWGPGGNPDHTFANVTELVERVLALPTDPTTSDGYTLVPLHAWSHNVTDALTVMQMLEQRAPGRVQVVPPDEFVRRVVANIPH